ncbi:ABC transporter ATP-binding protein [Aliikangiella marina]|nr:ABC transporter ATP-binding protein [Aliikangiella marina]
MDKFKRLLKIINYANPGKGLLTAIGLLSVLGATSSLLFPVMTQKLIDLASNSGQLPTEWIGILIAVLLGGSVASGYNFFLVGKVGNRMLVNIRAKILAKAIYLPVPYFDNTPSAEPASRAVNDTEIINGVVSQHFEPFISGLITLVASLVILWILDWQLTAVLFATLMIAFLITVPIAAKLTQLSKSVQKEEANFLSFITERFAQIRLIKAYNAEQETLAKSQQTLTNLYDLGLKEVRIGAIMAPIAGMTIISTLIIILVFGATRVSQGEITIGTLIAFILYLFNIVFPLIQFTYFFAELNKAAGAAERVEELLEETSEQSTNKGELCFKPGDITLQNVHFNFEPKVPLFKRLNMVFPKNKKIALVGASGAGKSTIFNLLLRFYQPGSGNIKIGDHSIFEFSLEDWRKHVALIAQDTPLLSGSIKDNLTLGLRQEISQRDLEKVIDAAELTEFIKTIPNGLEAPVGEKGVKLSGGQKQRIAIARAMLQDSPVLLCDEATSNLDATTEHKLQQAMNNLAVNRTTIVSAHRLSTVIDADLIYVLKGGNVIAEGTHEGLMKNSDYYQELVKHQFSALKTNNENPQQLEALVTP